jgi:hypothetical protein
MRLTLIDMLRQIKRTGPSELHLARLTKPHRDIEEIRWSIQAERDACGISIELWREYKSFCRTLQPDIFPRKHWEARSVFSYNGDHNDIYVKYDPGFK